MTVRAFKPKGSLDSGIGGMPAAGGKHQNEFYLYAAGLHTTTADAATYTNTLTVRGVKAGDLVLCTLHTYASTTLLTAKATKDTVTLVFAADPSTTHKVQWFVFKKRKIAEAAHRVY